MRKYQKRFISGFPEDKQDLIHKWMSESPEHDKLDILLIKHIRRLWRSVKLLFVKSQKNEPKE